MKNFFHIFAFVAVATLSFAAELSVPNLKPSQWVLHAAAGSGGIGVPSGPETYVNSRTTLRNAVTLWGIDPTGVTAVNATVAANLSAVGNEEKCYFPAGLYRLTSAIGATFKSNFSYAGDGEGRKSATSITFTSSGTITFTDVAGGPWVVGRGIRVWRANKPHQWMMGSVASYSGGSLGMTVTSSSGHTGTYTDFIVGETVLLVDGVGFSPFAWSAENLHSVKNLTANASVGATTITVADATGLAAGRPVRISRLRGATEEWYWNQAGERLVKQYNRIAGVSGNTVTLSEPLMFDFSTANVSRIEYGENSFTQPSFIGIEKMAIFATANAGNSPLLDFSGLYASWAYRVVASGSTGMQLRFGSNLRCEVAYSAVGWTRFASGLGNTEGTIDSGGGAQYAVRHAVIVGGSIMGQGGPDVGCAYLYNHEALGGWNINHGSGSSYFYFEGNTLPWVQIDGYHGGSKRTTFLRNYLYGGNTFESGGILYEDPDFPGFIVENRFSRENNSVGNVLGRTGVAAGAHSFGNPNIGNSANSGITSNSVLHTATSGVSGLLPLHVDAGGRSRITGELTSKTGDTATITLDTYTLTQLSAPHLTGTYPNHLVWGVGDEIWQVSGAADKIIINMTLGGSGSAITMTKAGASSLFPDVGTQVRIHVGEYGSQELDGAVEYTAFLRHNYKVAFGGIGGPGYNGSTSGIENSTTDTLPNSFAYSAQPSDWPAGMTWPPTNPDSPDFSITTARTPALHYWINGTWPEPGNTVATPQFSPSPGTHAAGTAITITTGTSGATLHVTNDDSTPTTSSPTYSGPISPSVGTTVLKALAVKSGMDDSAVASGTFILVNAPVAASGLNATTASTTQINVTWSDNSNNETGFRLERRIGSGSWSTVTTTAANATSYNNTGLTPATTYEYRVYAVNVAGDSTVSNSDSATTNSEGGGGGAATLSVENISVGTMITPP